ncbi:interferon gamma 1 [Cyprinodon tularosa]|uniref:interferon gamma 1 n=1 Tax=Cyprinodon tularosa TaxID=77115 RepID=UPI0018E27A06|nr:interferon gamma 1 [Cyprinodon tularosa]
MAAVMRRVVCIFMWLSVCQVSGAFIPNELNRTLQNLMQHYKISNQDFFNQKPVFPREPLKGNAELKMVYMYGVLEEYEKLLGNMLKQLPTPSPQLATSGTRTASLSASDEIRSNLMKVLSKMQELKRNNYKEQAALLEQLRKLEDIEVGNFKVQSKALSELTWIYEEASSLADDKRRRRRRRRQTRTRLHQQA